MNVKKINDLTAVTPLSSDKILIECNGEPKSTTLNDLPISLPMQTGIDQVKAEIAIERARIDNIASLPEGSTTGDAELIDIRVGLDGTTYDSAGEAVRSQIDGVNHSIQNVATESAQALYDFAENVDERFNKLKNDLINENSERINIDNKILSELLAIQRFISSLHSGYTVGTVVLGDEKAIAY